MCVFLRTVCPLQKRFWDTLKQFNPKWNSGRNFSSTAQNDYEMGWDIKCHDRWLWEVRQEIFRACDVFDVLGAQAMLVDYNTWAQDIYQVYFEHKKIINGKFCLHLRVGGQRVQVFLFSKKYFYFQDIFLFSKKYFNFPRNGRMEIFLKYL